MIHLLRGKKESGMPAGSSGQQRKAASKHTISRSGDLKAELARFGPVYGEDTEANKKAKDLAWKHIVDKSEEDANVTKNAYMKSIALIQQDALDCYKDQAILKLKLGTKFQETMVRDGCFFVQLALHILGGAKLLHYPKQNPYFGSGSDSTSWIPAMFFVGNQIPCVVIRALMKQDFFRKVIDEGIRNRTWQSHQRSGDDLTKLVLYRTVVEPEVVVERRLSFHLPWLPKTSQADPPLDIVHALYTSLLGPGNADPIYSEEMRKFYDLEAANAECDDKKVIFPSAGEMYKKGIKLKKAKRGGGISSIHFKNCVFWATLELPPLTIDAHTEELLTSLTAYEQQNLMESEHEVTAYVRFMRDLAHTYKDFKILEKIGLIRVVAPPDDQGDLKNNTVRMLDNFVSSHPKSPRFTLNFRQTMHKIADYGGPNWRFISFIVSILAIVQTIFTVLSYFFPFPHKS